MKIGEKSSLETVSLKETDPVNTGDSWTDEFKKWPILPTEWRIDSDVKRNVYNKSTANQATRNKLNELNIRCAIFYFFLQLLSITI